MPDHLIVESILTGARDLVLIPTQTNLTRPDLNQPDLHLPQQVSRDESGWLLHSPPPQEVSREKSLARSLSCWCWCW